MVLLPWTLLDLSCPHDRLTLILNAFAQMQFVQKDALDLLTQDVVVVLLHGPCTSQTGSVYRYLKLKPEVHTGTT